MKPRKIIILLIILITLVSALTSCKKIDITEQEGASVTYVYNNGDENKTEDIPLLGLKKPEDPKKDGYNFIGWCTDAELTDFYSFKGVPQTDITLYAKWEINQTELLEQVNTEAALFNVKVTAATIDILNKRTTQGSGVIFYKDSGFYYVLTNYHVVYSGLELGKKYYTYDVYGNEYNAEIIVGDPKYDLAIIRFPQKSGIKLSVAKIDKRIPSNKETLICLSSPSGRFNAVSFGNAVNYKSVEINNESGSSQIDFDVLWLDAYAEQGSSGGMVLDTDLEIVGIVYAVATSNGEFKYSLAVPAEKINEFLIMNEDLYK